MITARAVHPPPWIVGEAALPFPWNTRLLQYGPDNMTLLILSTDAAYYLTGKTAASTVFQFPLIQASDAIVTNQAWDQNKRELTPQKKK